MVAPRSFVLVERVDHRNPGGFERCRVPGSYRESYRAGLAGHQCVEVADCLALVVRLSPEGRRRQWSPVRRRRQGLPVEQGYKLAFEPVMQLLTASARGQAGDAVTYLGQANRRQVQGLDRLGVQLCHDTRTRSGTQRLGDNVRVEDHPRKIQGLTALSFRARSPSPELSASWPMEANREPTLIRSAGAIAASRIERTSASVLRLCAAARA